MCTTIYSGWSLIPQNDLPLARMPWIVVLSLLSAVNLALVRSAV